MGELAVVECLWRAETSQGTDCKCFQETWEQRGREVGNGCGGEHREGGGMVPEVTAKGRGFRGHCHKIVFSGKVEDTPKIKQPNS